MPSYMWDAPLGFQQAIPILTLPWKMVALCWFLLYRLIVTNLSLGVAFIFLQTQEKAAMFRH